MRHGPVGAVVGACRESRRALAPSSDEIVGVKNKRRAPSHRRDEGFASNLTPGADGRPSCHPFDPSRSLTSCYQYRNIGNAVLIFLAILQNPRPPRLTASCPLFFENADRLRSSGDGMPGQICIVRFSRFTVRVLVLAFILHKSFFILRCESYAVSISHLRLQFAKTATWLCVR
jgi:hypothetical protein